MEKRHFSPSLLSSAQCFSLLLQFNNYFYSLSKMISSGAACQIKAGVVTKLVLLLRDKVCLLFPVISLLCQGTEMQTLPIESSWVFSLLISVPHLVSFPLLSTSTSWVLIDIPRVNTRTSRPRSQRDSGVDTCRLLLTPADDNLTKPGTDEKTYELGWVFTLL